MKEEIQNIDQLIGVYLQGKLKDEEYARLVEYIHSGISHKEHFYNTISNWKPAENIELNNNWIKLNSKISRLDALDSSYKKKTLLSSTFIRIAAILIIGLFLGGIAGSMYFLGNFSNKNSLVFVAPKGEKSIITLSDSSKVWLNGGSRIEVGRNYGITNRKIKMEGEAYFEVSKNKFLPFKVDAGAIDIKVIGTKFNIAAYSNEDFIETTVKEGIVQVNNLDNKHFEPFRLNANQKAVFDKKSNKIEVGSADVETIIAWKNQMLILENQHYERVFKMLGNWFGVNFNIRGNLNHDPIYTMTIKTESLSEVMELLQFITPMEYKIEKDQVYVKFKEPN